MRIEEISAEITYPIRQAALYPNEGSDKILLKDDPSGRHFGLYVDEDLISILSLFQTQNGTQLRKFGTLPAYQGKGYGTTLLNHVLQICSGRIFLNARVEKMTFYQKFGFRETEETFTRNGIDYVVMAKD